MGVPTTVEQWERRLWATVYERVAWHHDIGEHDGTDLPYMFCPRCEVEHPKGCLAVALSELEALRAAVMEEWGWGTHSALEARRVLGAEVYDAFRAEHGATWMED